MKEASMGLAEDELRVIEERWLSQAGSPEARTLASLVDQASIDVGLLIAEVRRLQTQLRARSGDDGEDNWKTIPMPEGG
jgi:hypothetical protein